MLKSALCTATVILFASLAVYARANPPAGARAAEFGYDAATWSVAADGR